MNIDRRLFYDNWATHYDREQDNLTLHEEPTVLGILDRLQFEKVLDLGCGTGRLTRALLSNGADVTAVDFSEGMLRVFRDKYDADIPARIDPRMINIEKDPLPEGKYDLVFSTMMFGGVIDKGGLLARIREVLKPRGHLLVSTYHPIQALKRRMLVTGAHDPSNAVPFNPNWMTADYHAALVTNGFEVLEMHEPVFTEATALASITHVGDVGWPHVLVFLASRR